jgi:hypothetical protein
MRSNGMNSEKATYWMALAVLALGVGNHFATRVDGQCLVNRAMAAVQRLSSEGSRLVAMAQVALDRGTVSVSRSQVSFARVQSRFASAQNAFARQQVACARAQAEHQRIMALQQVQQLRMQVICPRQTLRMDLPQVEAPQVRVIPNADTI